MEAHVQPDIGAIQAPPVPTMSYPDVAACANDGLDPSTELSQTTGVGPTQNFVDLTDADDKYDKEELIRKVPKVEDVPETKRIRLTHQTMVMAVERELERNWYRMSPL